MIWRKFYIPFGGASLLFVAIGMGLSFMDWSPGAKILRLITAVTLIFFLFIESLRLHFPKVLHYNQKAFRAGTIGFFIQASLTALLAHYLLHFSWEVSTFIALALSAIDIKAMPIPSHISSIPLRMTEFFRIETALTTLLAVFLFMVFKVSDPYPILNPLLLGIAGGVSLSFIAKFIPRYRLYILFLAPFALFVFFQNYEWNGYIGVISLGLTQGHFKRYLLDGVFDLARRIEKPLYFLFLIVFGFYAWRGFTFTLPMMVFSLLVLFAARFFALLPSHLSWKTALFALGIGPRALVPAALAILFFPNPALYLTVLFSLVLHTLFAYPSSVVYAKVFDDKAHVPTIKMP